MKKLKKYGLPSFVKYQTILFASVGLLCGILYSFGGLVIDGMVSLGYLSALKMETPGLCHGTLPAFGALFEMPLIGACFGLVNGIIRGLIYNLLANRFPALQVDVKV